MYCLTCVVYDMCCNCICWIWCIQYIKGSISFTTYIYNCKLYSKKRTPHSTKTGYPRITWHKIDPGCMGQPGLAHFCNSKGLGGSLYTVYYILCSLYIHHMISSVYLCSVLNTIIYGTYFVLYNIVYHLLHTTYWRLHSTCGISNTIYCKLDTEKYWVLYGIF